MPSAATRRTIKPRCWPPAKTKTGTHHFLTYDGAAAPRVFLWGDEMWSTPGAAGWGIKPAAAARHLAGAALPRAAPHHAAGG